MSDILVGAGSAMVLLGLRETTNDVDMSVPVDIFEDYLTEPPHISEIVYDETWRPHHIDLVNGISLRKHMGFKLQLKADQGFFIQHPKDILDLKLELNREKDQADIRALREVASIWGY
jgi:hypothetical protein